MMEAAVSTREDDDLTELVTRARAGDSRAFDDLATGVRGRVRRWARRLLGDADDAEDVAQLVLMRLHSRLDAFAGRGTFASWLYRLTRNIAIDRARSQRRRQMMSIDEADQGLLVDMASDHAHDNIGDVADWFTANLSARQRAVFMLCDVDGLDSAEAAKQLGISPSTARVHLTHARRAIRKRLMEDTPELWRRWK